MAIIKDNGKFGNDPEEVVCNSVTNVDDDLQYIYRKWVG